MDMCMAPVKDESPRDLLVSLSSKSTDSEGSMLSPTPRPDAHFLRTTYTESQYSRSQGSGMHQNHPSQSSYHQPSEENEHYPGQVSSSDPEYPQSPTHVFCNGVNYTSEAPSSNSNRASLKSPKTKPLGFSNIVSISTAPLAIPKKSLLKVRFAKIATNPAIPQGDGISEHSEPSEQGGSSRLPVSKKPSQYQPFGDILSCCSTSRPGTPPLRKRLHSGSGHTETPITDDEHGLSGDPQSTGDLVARLSKSDPERGPPNIERVVLRIDGLKCGCCEGGLTTTLARIPAIKNYQVNAVLARVELDLDTNRCSIGDVIKKLESSTGFHCERQVASDGQVLELIISDPRRLSLADQRQGVLRIEAPERASWRPLQLLNGRSRTIPRTSPASGNDTTTGVDPPFDEQGKHGIAKIRIPPTKIHYDATQIGARTVYEYYKRYDPDMKLAPLSTDPAAEIGAKQTKRALQWFIPTCTLTIPVLVFAWTPLNEDIKYAHASLALASLVQLIAFKEFVPSAIRSLYRSRILEMDFLVAISTTIAYTYSVVSYVLRETGSHRITESFFEASTLLVTLILLGRVINEFARFQAAKSVSFRSLQSDEALVVENPSHLYATWANIKTTRMDARLLQYGDVFMVPPHTRIVTDGIVLYGGSNVDESMITGEFEPRAKGLESEVFAGTNNGEGLLVVKLTRLPHENSVHEIAAMVEDVELIKPKAQALADRIAAWFVPTIGVVGLAVFITWLLVGVYLYGKPWSDATLNAIPYTIATLIVSCPCAIGLAVPMVILIAGGVAARHGIIFRDPQKLEIARNVTDVIFDKTGTVTCAKLEVVGIPKYRAVDKARTKGLLFCLLKDIKHPVSEGIWRYLEGDMLINRDFESLEVSDIISIPGEGVKGICVDTGEEIRAGNAGWLQINEIGKEVNTTCHCTIGGDLHVSFELIDRTRPGAEMVIKKLHARKINVHLLSGDNESAVADIAGALYIRRENTKSGCKPAGKMNYIKDLQDQKKVVMFVGDGTNDSVALKQANVGVHVNQGSDIAKSAADVVLMTTRLHDILILLDISKAAYRRIVLNFLWSALYNLFAVSLAAGAFIPLGYGITIPPQYAGLGELVSLMPIVLIACQMRWRDYGHQYRAIEIDYQKVEAPKRERRLRSQTGSSTDSAGCCEISATTLARIDAMTR